MLIMGLSSDGAGVQAIGGSGQWKWRMAVSHGLGQVDGSNAQRQRQRLDMAPAADLFTASHTAARVGAHNGSAAMFPTMTASRLSDFQLRCDSSDLAMAPIFSILDSEN